MSKPEIRCIQGRYSIWMNDKCIHGGIYTEGEAKSYLNSYENIYYQGYFDAQDCYQNATLSTKSELKTFQSLSLWGIVVWKVKQLIQTRSQRINHE